MREGRTQSKGMNVQTGNPMRNESPGIPKMTKYRRTNDWAEDGATILSVEGGLTSPGVDSFVLRESEEDSDKEQTIKSSKKSVRFEERKGSPQVVLPPSQVPVVSTPPATQQAISKYYLCYDYTWFINLWNEALKQACSSFSGITQYPFFAYNATTQLISLYTPASFKENDPSMTPYKIWINNSFLTYFVGMEKVNQNQNSMNNPQGLLDNYLDYKGKRLTRCVMLNISSLLELIITNCDLI